MSLSLFLLTPPFLNWVSSSWVWTLSLPSWVTSWHPSDLFCAQNRNTWTFSLYLISLCKEALVWSACNQVQTEPAKIYKPQPYLPGNNETVMKSNFFGSFSPPPLPRFVSGGRKSVWFIQWKSSAHRDTTPSFTSFDVGAVPEGENMENVLITESSIQYTHWSWMQRSAGGSTVWKFVVKVLAGATPRSCCQVCGFILWLSAADVNQAIR